MGYNLLLSILVPLLTCVLNLLGVPLLRYTILRKILFITGLIIILGALVSPLRAEEEYPIEFQADRWEISEQTILGEGNVQIKYRDLELKSGEVKIDLETGDLWARGDVLLREDTKEVHGQELEYNLQRRTGQFYQASSFTAPVYYRGEVVKILSPQLIELTGGQFSTCKLEEPQTHYKLKARKISIYLGDKIIARDLVVYIKNFPVFYFPYYARSLKEEIAAPLDFRLGYDERGTFFTLFLNYYFSGYSYGTLSFNYVEKKGLGGSIKQNYKIGERQQGSLFLSYFSDKELLIPRWKTLLEHQYLGVDNSFYFSFTGLSDSNFQYDFSSDPNERYAPESKSYLYWVRTFPNATLNLGIESTRDLKEDTTLNKFPTLSYQEIWHPAGEENLYFRKGLTATNYQLPNQTIQRAELQWEIAAPTSPNNFLYLSPRASITGLWYNVDQYGRPDLWQLKLDSQISLQTYLYGHYPQFRHIFEPQIIYAQHLIHSNYELAAIPQLIPEDIEPFWYLDVGITNLFQIIKGTTYQDFLSLSLKSKYDFLQEEKFTTFDSSFRFTPDEKLTINLDASYDRIKNAFLTLDTGFNWQISPGWEFQLYSTYNREKTPELSTVQGNLTFPLGMNLEGNISANYDLINNNLIETEYSLHQWEDCYETRLGLLEKEGYYKVWLKINLLAFPQEKVNLYQDSTNKWGLEIAP